jgi:hypothetical protein
MAATVDGAILHTPPVEELLSEIVLPTQTGAFPDIGPGKPFTVTITKAEPHVVV